MLREQRDKQQQMEIVILEQYIPKDHLLRKIDQDIDFSFIHDICKPLYCPNNGRPAIDPEILFRMLFVGYLYGIRSERRLEEEINYNMAYKWFCGLGLTEKAPDATTISANRKRRFCDNDIAEKIFDEILRQAIRKGLVGGQVMYTDSTHIKAKANKHKKQTVMVEKSPKVYLKELDDEVDLQRERLGKKPFDRDCDDGSGGGGAPVTREIQQSKTDPESGQLHRMNKPDGFHYLEHRTVDAKRNVITNVHVTAANVNDTEPIPEIAPELKNRLGYLPLFMGLDAGYHSAAVCREFLLRGVTVVVGRRRHTHKHETFGKYRFQYDPEKDVYRCPEGHELRCTTISRDGYRNYFCDTATCAGCPHRKKCFGKSMTRKMVTRHVWQDYLDAADEYTKTPLGARLYKRRKETIERSFAEAKELHGLRYARMLGLRNMREQCFLTAAVQNMKRIARSFRTVFPIFVSIRLYVKPHVLQKHGVFQRSEPGICPAS
jgi:transposase